MTKEIAYFAICKNCWLVFEGHTKNGVVPKSKNKVIQDHFKQCDEKHAPDDGREIE